MIQAPAATLSMEVSYPYHSVSIEFGNECLRNHYLTIRLLSISLADLGKM